MRSYTTLFIGILLAYHGSVTAQEQVQIHGLLQARAVGIADTSIYEGYDKSTFYLRRGEISIGSTMLDRTLHWEIRIDPVALSGKIVQDAYAEYTFSEAVMIRLGQFKYPQSLDGRYPTAKLDLIRRSLLGRIYGDKRDIGIQLSGTTSRIEYAIGVFNGNGRNLVDNNKEKDIAGRVAFRPNDWLNVGGSFYIGKSLFSPGTATSHNGKLERFGGEARVSWSGLTIQTEYMVGMDDAVKNRSWYLQAAYRFLTHANAVARFDHFNRNTTITGGGTTVLTFGGSYSLGENVQLAVNYLIVSDKSMHKNANELLAQWQVSF